MLYMNFPGKKEYHRLEVKRVKRQTSFIVWALVLLSKAVKRRFGTKQLHEASI